MPGRRHKVQLLCAFHDRAVFGGTTPTTPEEDNPDRN
jgi:hypothetical protein